MMHDPWLAALPYRLITALPGLLVHLGCHVNGQLSPRGKMDEGYHALKREAPLNQGLLTLSWGVRLMTPTLSSNLHLVRFQVVFGYT
jgi:hypothetical protein